MSIFSDCVMTQRTSKNENLVAALTMPGNDVPGNDKQERKDRTTCIIHCEVSAVLSWSSAFV